MSSPLLFLTGIVLFFYFLTIGYLFKHKKEVPSMAGMITSMALGMLVGLLGGTIAGVYFAGNLFFSTIIGSGIGMAAGIFPGLPFHFPAVLEGVLSGLMGGMMGAMLGAMISSVYVDEMILILFLLEFLLNVMILYFLVNEQKERKESIGEKWLKSPVFMSIAMGFIFYLFNMMGPIHFSGMENGRDDRGHHHMQNNTPPLNISGQTVKIKADDFIYSPPDIRLEKNKTVTIKFENTGQMEHDLQVDSLKADVIKAENPHSRENSGIHLHAKPGERSSVTFKPVESGTYIFYCTLPGHKEAGMLGSFTVF